LTMGATIGQANIGLMFTLVFGPMIFFGCIYFPWSTLASFPVLQMLVLINPVVYASEGFRATLVPGAEHLPGPAIAAGLLLFNVIFLALGLRQFRKKAIT